MNRSDLGPEDHAGPGSGQADHLLDTPTDMIVMLDTSGILLGANQPFAARLGKRREDMIGLPVWDLFPPQRTAFRRAHFEQVVHSGQAVRLEEEVAGSWFDVVVHPMSNAEGSVIRIAVVAREITERKRMEQVLRESEGLHRTLFEHSPVVLWDEDRSEIVRELARLRKAGVSDFGAYFEADPEAATGLKRRIRVIDVNRAALALYKVGSREELQLLVDRPLDTFDLDAWRKELVAIAGGATSFEAETIRRTSGGEPRRVSLKWSAAPGREDTLSRILVSVVDTTERLRLEEEMRRSWEMAARGQQLLLALSHAAQEALGAHTEAEICQTVGWAMTDLGFDTVIFGLTSDAQHLMVRHSSYAPSMVQAADALLGAPGLHYRFRLPPGGPIHRLLQQGGALLLDEPARAMAEMLPESLRPRAPQLVALLGAGQAICASLGSGDGAFGLLVVIGKDLCAADTQAVSAFANQTAIALSNARLYHAARTWAAELEQRVAQRSTEVAAAETRYQMLFDRIADALIVMDVQGRCLDVNPAASSMLGYSREEFLGMDLLQVTDGGQGAPPGQREELLRQRWAVWQQGTSSQSTEWMRKAGQRVAVEVTVTPLIYAGQQAVLAAARDITEQKRVMEALRRSQEETLRGQRLLLALSEAGQAVQQARTREQVLRTIGDQIERLGYHVIVMSPAEDDGHLVLTYATWQSAVLNLAQELTHLRAVGLRIPLAPDGLFRRILDSGESAFCEHTRDLVMRGMPRLGRALVARAISILDIECSIYARLAAGGKSEGLLAVLGADLTQTDVPAVTAFANQAAIALENAHLLEELTTGRKQMETLAGQVVSAQEDERRRLSRALHDEAGQSLTALAISLELIGQDLPAEQGEVQAQIHDAVSLSRQTLDRIRNLAQDLRPPALDAVGLSFTLKGLCQDFAIRTRLAIDYRGQELPRLPEAVEIMLYRFLQESLTNVVRHANALHVRVALDHDAETLRLMVQDDGRGFDPRDGSLAMEQPRGLGLLGMQERLRLLGGWLEILSAPGKGTCVVAHVPVEEWEDGHA